MGTERGRAANQHRARRVNELKANDNGSELHQNLVHAGGSNVVQRN
jgi:hypothetical protein